MKELEIVVLTQDLPDLELMAGDIGTIVMIHQTDQGYEVEFTTLDGATVAIETLLPDQIRPIGRGEIAHVRKLPEIYVSP